MQDESREAAKNKQRRMTDDGRNGGRIPVDKRTFLRKKDLVDALGVAKSTVADWVAEFQAFIPTVREGNTVYYKPEAIEVLQTIKTLREQGFSKSDIYGTLQTKGFPLTIQDATDDVAKLLTKVDARRSLVSVMEQVGNALERIADQDEAIEFLEKRQDGQDGRMTEVERQLQELRQELANARAELAATKDRKHWWSLWGRSK